MLQLKSVKLRVLKYGWNDILGRSATWHLEGSRGYAGKHGMLRGAGLNIIITFFH
jgi:hypothetical protein